MKLLDLRLRRARSRAAAALALCALALLATLAGAGTAGAATPATVDLHTAAPFALLAGSAISDVPAPQSTINGNVGLSPTTGAAITGPSWCTEVTGTLYAVDAAGPACAVADAGLLTTAKNDLGNAYTDAANRPSATTVLTELGGQTLVAGVYNSADGNFGMTGTLTLDGANNADSVFIFQTADITGALTTAGSAGITLIRGAQACNIFWKIGSSATLGASSTFRGTLMANASITVGHTATVDGRLLARTAAVSLDNDTIVRPSTCVSQSALDAATAATAAASTATASAAAATAAAATAEAARKDAARQWDDARAAAVLADTAAKAAAVAADAAAKAKAAADEVARVAAANAAEVIRVAAEKAAAAAKVAARKAAAARASAVKAAQILRIAKANSIARHRVRATPARARSGFTG